MKQSNDYIDYMKKVSDQMSNNYINKSNNNNNNIINQNYIITNFKDAYNFDDLMNPPLTDSEQKMLNKEGPFNGAMTVLETRCIDNIDIPLRPFHCVDTARNKFLLRNNNNWYVDNKGNKIIDCTFNKVNEEFDINDINDMNKRHNMQSQMETMYKNRPQIRNHLNGRTTLKNNVKPIKNINDIKLI
jgi:hypothetical protein